MKITAFGDSLTAGWGVRPGQDYPKLLEDGLAAMGFPGVQVLNRGISGETTSDLHYRVPGVLEERPDIILLGIGTNDILQGVGVASLRANLATLIDALIGQANAPLLCLLQIQAPSELFFGSKDDYDMIYPELALQRNLPMLPFMIDALLQNPVLMMMDGVHPNADGYEWITREHLLPGVAEIVRGCLEEK